MSISFVGTANGINSFSPPVHVAGDVLVVHAFRDGSNTAPTIPAGWTTIDTNTTNSAGGATAYRVAVDGATVSGTWTNATGIIVQVYRGVDTHTVIGGHAPATGASTTVSYPAITMTNATGSSWVVGLASHRSTDTNLQNAPTGMTARTTRVDATDELAGHDTNGGVSSWSLQTVSVAGTSSGWYGQTVELLQAGPLAYRQGVTASATTSPATTAAFASNPTVGQLIIVTTSDDSGVTNNVTGVTDNKGNTYTQIMASASATGFQMWYTVVVSTGASFIVSAAWTPASAGRCVVVAQEFSGFTATPTLDKQVNTGSTGTAVDTGATAATTATNELVVSGVSFDSTAATILPGTSFWNINGVNIANASAHQASKTMLATAQTPHGLFTISASRIWVSGVVTFKDVSSGVSASVTQVAATVTATGGTQTIATVNNASITQLAATVTATGGTQVIASKNIVAITQIAANVTATGGTQTVTSVSFVSIAQLAATVTATGGTQAIVTTQSSTVAQLSATVTATGGTQTVKTNSSIAQIAANVTATTGTQTIATVNIVAISQSAATLTATGGTQVLVSLLSASISQVAATVTASGGTQAIVAHSNSAITQIGATLTATTGTQSISAQNSVAITQVAAVLTITGGTAGVSVAIVAHDDLAILSFMDNLIVLSQQDSLLIRSRPEDNLIINSLEDSLFIRSGGDALGSSSNEDSLVIKSQSDSLRIVQ